MAGAIHDLLNLEIQPEEEYLGPNGQLLLTERAGHDNRLASYYWPAPGGNPKAIVHLVHGQC